uniref:Uncharacterized protein n=1 Tax=Leersia perrieri TaxID=77586 RepID=A0A0D9VIK9_9ORYZ
MARSTRSTATEQAYSRFAPPASRGVRGAARRGGINIIDEFDESDIWGSFEPSAVDVADEAPPLPTARPPAAGRKATKKAPHGSLPVNIPDWSKILGDEYRSHHAAAGGEWEADDVDDDDIDATATSDSTAVLVPPHELAWRRRAASLSVHGHDGMGMGIGRTLKVRDAVWKKTGFQA